MWREIKSASKRRVNRDTFDVAWAPSNSTSVWNISENRIHTLRFGFWLVLLHLFRFLHACSCVLIALHHHKQQHNTTNAQHIQCWACQVFRSVGVYENVQSVELKAIKRNKMLLSWSGQMRLAAQKFNTIELVSTVVQITFVSYWYDKWLKINIFVRSGVRVERNTQLACSFKCISRLILMCPFLNSLFRFDEIILNKTKHQWKCCLSLEDVEALNA